MKLGKGYSWVSPIWFQPFANMEEFWMLEILSSQRHDLYKNMLQNDKSFINFTYRLQRKTG